MAKSKTTVKKSVKKPTKYSKLLVVAQKELAAKKKALVAAERSLAKAKQKHEELVAEVARLDMVERSLKAVVEGTEPPTNIKYVYNYPQWVWYPCPSYPYVYTSPQPTIYWQNNLNTLNDGHSYTVPYSTVTCESPLTTGVVTTANAVGSTTYAGLTGTYADCSGSYNSSLNQLCNNVTLTTASATGDLGTFVVDLSTGAQPTDAPEEPVTTNTAPVGVGG